MHVIWGEGVRSSFPPPPSFLFGKAPPISQFDTDRRAEKRRKRRRTRRRRCTGDLAYSSPHRSHYNSPLPPFCLHPPLTPAVSQHRKKGGGTHPSTIPYRISKAGYGAPHTFLQQHILFLFSLGETAGCAFRACSIRPLPSSPPPPTIGLSAVWSCRMVRKKRVKSPQKHEMMRIIYSEGGVREERRGSLRNIKKQNARQAGKRRRRHQIFSGEREHTQKNVFGGGK